MAQAFARRGVIIHNENPALDGRANAFTLRRIN
jgi:hypothetical protein